MVPLLFFVVGVAFGDTSTNDVARSTLVLGRFESSRRLQWTWSKVTRDSQYQQEEVQDWTSHLEHRQAILIQTGADRALEESSLIRFFHERLKPSMKAQMEQRGRDLDSWNEPV